MPLDRTHQHISSDIIRADAVHTPIDPNGGGGSISATGAQGGSVANVTELQTPGTVRQVSAGVAAVGGSVVVSTDDPGAIGAFNLWLETVFADGSGDGGYGRLWVRNSANDGWNSGSPMTFNTPTDTLVSSPDDNAELSLASAGNDSYLSSARKLSLRGSGGVSVEVGGTAGLIILAGGPIKIGLGPTLQFGTIDPSAGGGVAATAGSIYFRDTGEVFWKRDDGGDTSWFSHPINGFAGTPAAHVADGATVDDLRDALVASGLMAAS